MVVLLITKPFEFKAKLGAPFSSGKPTTIQFGNLLYSIPELNTGLYSIRNISTDTYSIKWGNP